MIFEIRYCYAVIAACDVSDMVLTLEVRWIISEAPDDYKLWRVSDFWGIVYGIIY